MASVVFPASKNAMDRWKPTTGPYEKNAGGDRHLLIGKHASSGYIYRSYVAFALDWSEVGKITTAMLHLRTSQQVHVQFGSAPKIRILPLSSAFSEEAGSTEFVWDTPYQHPTALSTPLKNASVPATPSTDFTVDITDIVERWAPATVMCRDGSPGRGEASHGLMLLTAWEGDGSTMTELVSRHSLNGASLRPYITLTHEVAQRAPNAPDQLAPSGTLQVPPDYFTGDFTDANAGDTLYRTNIRLWNQGGTTLLWDRTFVASGAEVAANAFSVPIPDLVRSGVIYAWDARVQDQTGRWSAWSPKITFALSNTTPTLTLVSPLGLSVASMAQVRFKGTFSDINAADKMGAIQIQLRVTTAPGHPDWDTDTNLWDTGSAPPRLSEYSAEAFDRFYGGAALAAGGYSWRARVQDKWGAWSDWQYSTLTLTTAWSPDPGSIDFLSGYGERRSPTRVVFRQVDTSAGRGPKNPPVAVIEDAANIGASMYLNAGGEFYMTLPVNHPQVTVLEPYKVHYAVEYWRGDRYVSVFNGLLVDFDATDDDVVFYGTDYLALLNLLVDERFEAGAPEKSYTMGGSKYSAVALSTIIADQLAYARAKSYSPVNFITIGTLATFSEEATLYTTYAPILDTISGLVDSHRQGTGKRSRFLVREKAAGGFEFLLLDNPGVNRDNLRMEYGGLVQGFRLTAFGDFATFSHGVGRTQDGTGLFYKTAPAPGIDPNIYGRVDRVSLWVDVRDENDLTRRTKQVAMTAGRIGKRVALGLRVDALQPFDGYDIGDNILLDIRRGVVNTTGYGNGYWSILGVEWRTFPDGHTENTLVVLPKEDGSSPDPDLIPSVPVLNGKEWEIGWAPPTDGANTSKYYFDLTSRDTWQRDPDTGLYTNLGTDTEAPGVPTGLTLVAGPKSFLAYWDAVSPPDLAFWHLRYAVDDGSGAGPGGSPVWTDLYLTVSQAYVGSLIGKQKYWVQVRAVDMTGNVEETGPPVVARNYLAYPETGWTAQQAVTTILVDTTLLDEDVIDDTHINPGGISATNLKAGSLEIETVAGRVDGIKVYKSGVQIGLWDEDGLRIFSSTDSNDYILINEAGVSVFVDGVEVSALDTGGLNASAILQGTAPGGQNLLQNSSFEMVDFDTSTVTPVTWDVKADWDNTDYGTDVNIDESPAGDRRATTVTF